MDYRKLDFREQLLVNHITQFVKDSIDTMNIDVNQVVYNTAVAALFEIQKVLKNVETDDFIKIDQIVCIFEKYNIDSSPCHDF